MDLSATFWITSSLAADGFGQNEIDCTFATGFQHLLKITAYLYISAAGDIREDPCAFPERVTGEQGFIMLFLNIQAVEQFFSIFTNAAICGYLKFLNGERFFRFR